MTTTIKQPALERVRYFARQLMTAEDMSAEQDYFLERMRRHNRMLHGWGIVCGLKVQQAVDPEQHPWHVTVSPGFALSPQGDEISVADPVSFDLAGVPTPDEEPCAPCPCPPEPAIVVPPVDTTLYLAIRYVSRGARAVRVGHGNCGCSSAACEASRTRDAFELKVLSSLPVPYGDAPVVADPAFPVCPRADPGPWIILVDFKGPATGTHPKKWLRTSLRRVVPRVQDLRTTT